MEHILSLSYCFACQAVHLRDRLKMYEDVLFSEDGKELVTLDMLREQKTGMKNDLLTLEELREMAGEPVWVKSLSDIVQSGWNIAGRIGPYNDSQVLHHNDYGKTWLAYRRKPGEDRRQT